MSRDLPVKKNEEYILTIENMGINGEGIGRIEGYTLFISGAIPEEKVRIKVIKINKNYGYGKLMEIIEPSPYRVEPFCPYSTRCGGCQLQHLNYKAQLDYKTRLVKDAMERIAKIYDLKIHPTIGMDDPLGYRNKAQFPVGLVRDSLAIGFYAPRSHDIIDMDTCFIQHGINDDIIHIIRRFIKEYGISIYDEIKHRGIIRHIVTKVGFKSGQVMVIIVTNGSSLPHKGKLIDMLRNSIPGICSIVQNINREKTNVILGNKNITLWGQDYIVDTIGEFKFKISPLSFFQVNPVQTEVLYKKALEFANLTGNEIVVDAYSGIGTISLFLAKNAKKVYSVEVVKEAGEDAKENARINDINNVEFIQGESEVIIPKLVEDGLKIDVAVVDPPRKGCDARLLDALIKANPERIVYVSCNPATLARDLRYLWDRGYKAGEVQPVDMFPFTTHVECVTLMSRVEK